MKVSNKTSAGFFSDVLSDGITKRQPSKIKKETAPARLTVEKALKPFTGDLRSFGITERLKELFEAAKIAAESGKIMPRGSFLNITV
ncbi:hypothetical protein [Kiloniella sp. EL199]|uniref:hypothetical protein n=1 Tax=Kiloniella sp. EL199 TaxID=2107581 RepID=UPI000EA2863F|nr:hypothetical protein [Kiloniella sp. EL199]